MSRRQSLPGADELFRQTEPAAAAAGDRAPAGERSGPELRAVPSGPGSAPADDPPGAPAGSVPGSSSRSRSVGRRAESAERRPTGRERHEEKITVYVSPDELVDLEHAKLVLRAQHGLAIDRGRIVREAIAVIVADLEVNGEQSTLVRRLRGA